MKKLMLLLIVFSMFMTVSCNKKMIKGTNIEETPDSKEILTVFGHYLKGFKEQNPEIFMEYISQNYYDTNGTDEAGDDIDYDKIVEILHSDAFNSLEKVNITCIIKDLFFNDAEDKAELIYFYEVRFKMKSSLPTTEENAFIQPDGMTNQKVSENNKMKFVKEEDGKWKIVSGI